MHIKHLTRYAGQDSHKGYRSKDTITDSPPIDLEYILYCSATVYDSIRRTT